jgi:hypothetical protein
MRAADCVLHQLARESPAADLLLNVDEYSSQITADTLATTIQAMALKIDAEASVFRAAHPATPAWKAVAICWFKNRSPILTTNFLRNRPAC